MDEEEVGRRCNGADILVCVGPNVNDISNAVPEGCTVDQAAYVLRHGSRYPDQGAYNDWVTLYTKVSKVVVVLFGNKIDSLTDTMDVIDSSSKV